MTEKEIVRQAMEIRGFTQTVIAEKLGFKKPSSISDKLGDRSGNLKVEWMVQMLDVLGYDVIVKDRNTNGQTWKIELVKEE